MNIANTILSKKKSELSDRRDNSFIFPKMVQIPNRKYKIGKYQVTFDEFDKFCEDTSKVN